MSSYKYILPLVIIVLILSTITLAESGISAVPVKSLIKPNEKAVYQVTINNTIAEKQRYTLYSLNAGLGWDVETKPIKDKIIEIDPFKSYTTTLIIKPQDAYPPGIYAVNLNIESDFGEKQILSLKVYLLPQYTVTYNPTLKVDVDMDEKINPNNPLSIKLGVENKNPLNLTGLKIKIKSDLTEFNKDLILDIAPLEKKTAEFTVNPLKYQQPKHYTLYFTFEHNGEEFKVVSKEVEVLTQTPPFDLETKQKNVYAKQYYQTQVTNNGNVITTQEVKIPVSFMQVLISRGQEEVIREDSHYYLVWTTTLNPEESIVLNYTINYFLYIYTFLLIIALIAFYFYVQPPVIITKKAIITEKSEEDAPAEIKITLELKNKKKKTVKNLTITDLIPGIAIVEQESDIGTLKPQEIRNTHQGTKIQWHIAELEGEEQRIITYKVRTKINILGSFKLPRAKVGYRKKGFAKNAYSEPVTIGK
ncbi:hypothetical protein HYX11_04030 [Candidatus Woesearchaeota archaeon]|nr:hypothetical protein [Candidatus Woesearchaeota archaeon]